MAAGRRQEDLAREVKKANRLANEVDSLRTTIVKIEGDERPVGPTWVQYLARVPWLELDEQELLDLIRSNRRDLRRQLAELRFRVGELEKARRNHHAVLQELVASVDRLEAAADAPPDERLPPSTIRTLRR